MVQDLFIPRTREWDIELLQELSCPRDVQAIAQTPASTTRGGDQLIWHFTKNGMYLVKSGYRLFLSGRDQHVSAGNRGNWLTIWNLKLPPRVKIFLWHACLGCLPVLATLQGRGVQLNPLCPICHQEPETIMHALLLCGNVNYHLANYNLDLAKWAAGSLANVILTNSPLLSKAQVSTLATVLWTIWKQQNAKVWNGRNLPPLVAVQQSFNFVSAWNLVRDNHPLDNPTKPSIPCRWSRPRLGHLKCNIDGSFFRESLQMGVGCAIRDDSGCLVQAFTRTTSGCSAPNEVEAHALREALHWIIQLQLGNIIVETNCKNVVDAFHSHKVNLLEFGCLIADCRRLAPFVENLTLSFTKQQANSAAHALVRATQFHASPSSWLKALTFLVDDLTADVLSS